MNSAGRRRAALGMIWPVIFNPSTSRAALLEVREYQKDKIMKPFFTTKGVGKGTGLGLSISQSIAHAHGGVLELNESSPHTRFVLVLPQAHERLQTA